MSKRDGELDKREIRLPDGRRLIFYSFPDPPSGRSRRRRRLR